MPLQCNIDARGKLARLVWGLLLLILAVVLLFTWTLRAGSAVAWVVTVACFVGGAFAIFEARAGWCVIRAMGIKTPL